MKNVIILLAVLALWVSDGRAQTSYYQGKTIRFIVGYPAGSTHDLWARLVGPHMTKYIPGNPNIIVQNMPGAGSATAANYVYGVAKPDGLSIAVVRGALLRSIVRTQGSAFRLGQVRVGRQHDAFGLLAVHVGRGALQDDPRCSHGRDAAEMRQHRHG